ncbi:hypothetical protein [Actinoplanes ianthinogenes]|uniref:hypothetical protein n=1 Tax=Actinoplanes ianthinogenes TaxID=122358 RepID=UPI00166F9784|nr:hypothetical protein [Actinoplanes ianthinogenes]
MDEEPKRVDRAGLARVILAIATESGWLTADEWRRVAALVLAAGGDWPAVADLAAGCSAVPAAEERLVEQLTAEIGDRPRLDFHSVVAGVAARAYTLGAIADHDFIAVLSSHGSDAYGTKNDSEGGAMMWEVWAQHSLDGSCAEFGGSGTSGYDEEDLRVRGDRLIPPDSITGPLGAVLADVLHG